PRHGRRPSVLQRADEERAVCALRRHELRAQGAWLEDVTAEEVTASRPMIELRDVAKIYQTRAGSTFAVGNVSLSVAAGEFVSLVGPSGCGKSTLLNLMAGFMSPSAGAIEVDGRPVAGEVPPALGYIF